MAFHRRFIVVLFRRLSAKHHQAPKNITWERAGFPPIFSGVMRPVPSIPPVVMVMLIWSMQDPCIIYFIFTTYIIISIFVYNIHYICLAWIYVCKVVANRYLSLQLSCSIWDIIAFMFERSYHHNLPWWQIQLLDGYLPGRRHCGVMQPAASR